MFTAWAFLLFTARADSAVAQPADDEGEGEIIVIDDAGDTSGQSKRIDRALSESSTVSEIVVDEDTPPSATASELIGKSVGAEIRSVGGLGGFSSVSVRGLGAGHTPVLLDGVPLSRIATDTVDLSRFDLHGLASLELYRGSVPAAIGASGMGGALNLISAVGPRPAGQRGLLSAGFGSFGARHLRGRYLGGDQGLGYQLGFGYAGAEGDYRFFNDNGTNLNTADDTFDRRTNNGFDRVDAVLRAREVRGDRTSSGGARVIARQQGLPGIGSRQTESSHLNGVTGVIDTQVGERLGDTVVRGQGFAMFDRSRVVDEDAEVGIGSGSSLSDTVSVGVLGGVERAVGPRIRRLALVAELRGDWFRQVGGATQRGSRNTSSATAETDVAIGSRAHISPQLRVDVTRSVSESMPERAPRTDVDFNPRVAALYRPGISLAFKASAGYAVRQPTIVELFGDRGFLAGNPEIRAERGPSADVAVVFAPLPTRTADDLFLELTAFAARPKDAIVYAPSAGGVARPFNVEGATLKGSELSATVRLYRALRLSGNYTFLSAVQRSDSETLDGNALPHRSRHQGDVSVALESGRFAVWGEISTTSGNFTDQANIIELPARTFLAAGARLPVTSRLTIIAEGKNLSDNTVEMIELDPAPRPDLTEVPRAVSDFFGYPLPGRAFYLSLSALL